jgi:hypothetical protein
MCEIFRLRDSARNWNLILEIKTKLKLTFSRSTTGYEPFYTHLNFLLPVFFVVPTSTDINSILGTSTVTPRHQRARTPNDELFSELGDRDLSAIIQAAALALQNRGCPLPPSLLPHASLAGPSSFPQRVPDMWDNAKVEQIICASLKQVYDSSQENLLPTLNLIQIRRKNEVWCPATYLLQYSKTVDLVQQFSQVREETVLN